jgi:hypothetical protein
MKALAGIAILTAAVTVLSAPATAQDRPAKDGDEVAYSSYDQPEDHGDAVRPCQQGAMPVGRGGLSRLAVNLTAPERYWLMQNARRLNPATGSRCR